MSNILYVSCHSVLEYDEIKILKELGHQVFSCGAYITPQNPQEKLRDPVKLIQNKDWINIYNQTKCRNLGNGFWFFSKEFLDIFDTVIFMHSYQGLINSMKMFSGKKVFWRTIGQSNTAIEKSIAKIKNDIKIIRYSERESLIPGYCGQDYLIRFYKDKNDFQKWEKQVDKICVFYNAFHARSKHFNLFNYEKYISKLPHEIFGRNNVEKNFMGEKTYDEQRKILSSYASNYVINTNPASYTLSFIEAMAAGCPMIIDRPSENNLDERMDLLNGDQIFYNTDISDESILMEKIRLQNICFDKFFSKDIIKKQWNKIF